MGSTVADMETATLRAQLDDRLRTLGIELRLHTHKAAPTCTVHEAELANWDVKGVPLVNLFVRAKKNQQLFLICTPAERKVSLMAFQREIMKYSRANMIRFAPEEIMYPSLKVHPGCATPLAAMFADEKLTVVIDKAIMDSEQLVMVHPLVNTQTCALYATELLRFLQSTAVELMVVDLPEREA